MTLLRTLWLALAFCPNPLPAAPADLSVQALPIQVRADDEERFHTVLGVFQQALAGGSPQERSHALLGLLAESHPGVLPALAGALGELAWRLHELQAKIEQLEPRVRQKQRLIADLQLRVDRDRSLEQALKGHKLDLEDLEQQLARRRELRAQELPWEVELSRATLEHASQVPSGVRKKLLKSSWKTLGEPASFAKRFAALGVLAALGEDGTATRLQKSIVGFVKQRSVLQRKLPKQMGEVRELEARMQEEAERSGGRSSYGQQYDRLIQGAKRTQEEIGQIGRMCEALLQAGGRALAREDTDQRAKSVQALMRAQKKGRHGVRGYTLRLLGASGLGQVQAALLSLLREEPDPLGRSTLIEALAQAAPGGQTEELETYLLEHGLQDESWLVRGGAVRTLALLRSQRALPRLIERLALEEGRTRDELDDALQSLTGLDYHANAALWERWWREQGEAFVLPSVAEVQAQRAQREENARGGTGFFGITSASEHVLFVVDLSGSMVFAMIPRDNPEDDISGGRRPDMPREGEHSRLEEAKLALASAIGGMGREGTFNLIFYASDVWAWSPAPRPMTDKNVAQALDLVSELDALGGTNIYGALRAALDMAGAETTDRWQEPRVDTIFFLSDGRASIGITTDADEILAFVRERNASAGITIHTIGLSGAQDAYLLSRLAEENGGRYVAR